MGIGEGSGCSLSAEDQIDGEAGPCALSATLYSLVDVSFEVLERELEDQWNCPST